MINEQLVDWHGKELRHAQRQRQARVVFVGLDGIDRLPRHAEPPGEFALAPAHAFPISFDPIFHGRLMCKEFLTVKSSLQHGGSASRLCGRKRRDPIEWPDNEEHNQIRNGQGVNMRTGHIIAALACVGSAASAASADYYLQIKGVAAEGGYTFLDVLSTGDLDGDGLPDEAVVRLRCVGADIQAAEYSVKSPRDAASGQASGKRTHKPVTFVKEWGPTTPQLAQVRPGYNVKENKGARAAAAGDGWTAISLSDAPSLCADSTAALKATKTRSNIQNN